MTGESPPRRTWEIAAPQAPVPDDCVSPTPRSKMRARMRSGASSVQNETLVRLGKRSAVSIGGPISARSSVSSRARSSTRIAVCGLPMTMWWNRQPSISPSPSSVARPMSVRQLCSPVMLARISPASVWIE